MGRAACGAAKRSLAGAMGVVGRPWGWGAKCACGNAATRPAAARQAAPPIRKDLVAWPPARRFWAPYRAQSRHRGEQGPGGAGLPPQGRPVQTAGRQAGAPPLRAGEGACPRLHPAACPSAPAAGPTQAGGQHGAKANPHGDGALRRHMARPQAAQAVQHGPACRAEPHASDCCACPLMLPFTRGSCSPPCTEVWALR